MLLVVGVAQEDRIDCDLEVDGETDGDWYEEVS